MASFYQSLYRKWRPQKFSDVVGQEYIVRTLQNAVATNQIAHAYMFAGPRGVGKTTIARLFAKAVNCKNPTAGEPDNSCENCLKITKGTALDVIEIDGASNRGIDQIRQLREEVNFMPAEIRYKVYIIDEVHMLTNEAFNALLKTLEEPPKHVIFIFATTEAHKVPTTVISRCQAYDFKNHHPEQIEKQLAKIGQTEKIQTNERVLRAIAVRARGGMRDAIVMLEQLSSFKGDQGIDENDLYEIMGLASEETVHKFLNAILQKESRTALEAIASLAERGKDLELFVDELISQTRDSLILVLDNQKAPVNASAATLIQLSSKLLELKRELSRAWEKRILLEVKALELINQSTTSVSTAPTVTQQQPQPAQPMPIATPAPALKPEKIVPAASASSTSAPKGTLGLESKPAAKPTASQPAKEQPVETQMPAPKPEPVVAASPTSVPSITAPSDISGNKWQQLLNELKRERRSTIHAFLMEGQPVEMSSALRIEYPPQSGFHKEGLEKNRTYLEAMVKKIYGKRLEIAFAGTESASGNSATVKPAKKSVAREKAELVQKIFDGEIINEH
ncbi:DNA polymerase III subunit gamma/tau [Candidatus Acetothermia bacterium]|nr:DNA polymerase III subunit gamma/tau [Candidatus Acetothermia bacterium]